MLIPFVGEYGYSTEIRMLLMSMILDLVLVAGTAL